MKEDSKVFIKIDATKQSPKDRGRYFTNRGMCDYCLGAWMLYNGDEVNATGDYVVPAWWLMEVTISELLAELRIDGIIS